MSIQCQIAINNDTHMYVLTPEILPRRFIVQLSSVSDTFPPSHVPVLCISLNMLTNPV